jgi:hypothetical protein
MVKPWLSGFIEGEGSFYLVAKDSNSIVHGFGLRQKWDKIVLKAIKLLLHITTGVGGKDSNSTFYTIHARSIENVMIYFKNNLIGIQSIPYTI